MSNKRNSKFLCLLVFGLISPSIRLWAQADSTPTNLAPFATAQTSYVSPFEKLESIQNNFNPTSSFDQSHGEYGNWPQKGDQWVEYDWPQPITTNGIKIYWWQDGRGVHLPFTGRLLTWDGHDFVPVPGASALGISPDRYNTLTFPELTTSKLRIEFTGKSSTGILQWKVLDSGNSPTFTPRVEAGHNASVAEATPLQLQGDVQPPTAKLTWSVVSGPGSVHFTDPSAAKTEATFSSVGLYVIKLTAALGDISASSTVQVQVNASM